MGLMQAMGRNRGKSCPFGIMAWTNAFLSVSNRVWVDRWKGSISILNRHVVPKAWLCCFGLEFLD
jgi:hypothetical protein